MYKKIMVPLDGSELAECVLPHVEIFIKECRVNNVIFVRVVEPTSTSFTPTHAAIEALKKINEMDESRQNNAGQYLKQIADKFKNGTTHIHTEAVLGSIPDTIIDYVDKNKIDLIIMATHGRSGVSRWVRGSVADKVLRASSVPILLVRAPGTGGAI